MERPAQASNPQSRTRDWLPLLAMLICLFLAALVAAHSVPICRYPYDANANLHALAQRIGTMEAAVQSNALRIDNVWDALGPPNVNGTYFAAAGESDKTACPAACPADRELAGVKKGFEEKIGDVHAQVAALKKETQRADVRVMSRLEKVERRVAWKGL